jgi:hypothetical protein
MCYGTTASPTSCTTVSGTTGAFTLNITGLTTGTLYYYRGKATNSTGTSYSSDGTFTPVTPPSTPTITTPTKASITATTATLGADITSDGGASITARGTCWGTSPSPTTNCTAEGGTSTGVFTQARTGLSTGVLTYYRGYATNSVGTNYSADDTFTPATPPSDEHDVAYLLLTSFLPKLLLLVFFPLLLIGIALRFMRNPTSM